MIVLPAIDIYNQEAVRLRQGKTKDKTVYHHDPSVIASYFERIGAPYIHIVDLNGATEGSSLNAQVIKNIANQIRIPFEIGGGIHTREDAESYLNLGAFRIIIGSKAVEDKAFIRDLIQDFGEKVAVSLDCREDKIATKGWRETTDYDLFETAKELEDYGLSILIYTDISRDGMLTGPNLEMLERLKNTFDMDIIASGGISSIEDLKALEALDLYGAITGKAVYEGKIDLESLFDAR